MGAATVLGVMFTVVSVLAPMPFVELAPGPTFNVIGDVGGKPLLEISGTTTYPTDGHLDMTTVNERGGPGSGIYVGRVLAGWARADVKILPREAFYPDGASDADVKADNVRQFSDSESDSVAAALTYLKIPFLTLVIVASVQDGTPADGNLEPGDQFLAIDARPIRSVADVHAALTKVKPGDTVKIKVRREKSVVDVSVVTTSAPADPRRAYLGIAVGETYRAKFTIDINLDNVGGPSAGTLLSLGIIDKLTPGALNGGKYVAGTGTIAPDGTVGAIGGIAQKMAGARGNGATLFLAPADNCADVLQSRIPDGLTVARIATLTDAVNAVEAYAAGKPVTPCS
jgi:PDZ domain-containing protein